MRLLIRGLIISTLVFLMVSCNKTLKPEEIPAHIVVGQNYYTQFVIRYEKSTHLTTNYRRGASIPVNSRITLLKISSKTIEFELDNSTERLLIKNVPKHTGDDIFNAFDKLFASKKVNLAKFNALERRHIKQGTVAKGMRKKAVLVAIGCPPTTQTVNLDANTWVYWSGRFNRFNVNFKNGKVSSVVD